MTAQKKKITYTDPVETWETGNQTETPYFVKPTNSPRSEASPSPATNSKEAKDAAEILHQIRNTGQEKLVFLPLTDTNHLHPAGLVVLTMGLVNRRPQARPPRRRAHRLQTLHPRP